MPPKPEEEDDDDDEDRDSPTLNHRASGLRLTWAKRSQKRIAKKPLAQLQRSKKIASTFFSKTTSGDIEISYYEFNDLKQTTKDQIISVYERTMRSYPLDSYGRIWKALRFLGVGVFKYTKSHTTPEDLLANWVYERNKIANCGYDSNSDTLESLKAQAFNRHWGLGALKTITARWIQGKDQDRLLKLGRDRMALEDKTSWAE